jgi:putative transcriptional regulator
MPKRTRRGRSSGRVQVPDVDVTAIRHRLEMSQQMFADHFGIPIQTLRHWEQGLRRPDEAARAYLLVISRMPDKVLEALGRKGK